MIVSIKGILINKMPNEIIIETGGIGYACFISTNTYDSLPKLGLEICLFTYFHVTENSQNLFAFNEIKEKELFLLLISVSGIGPKTAIVLLSAVSADEFKRRLIAGEVSMLTSLPGIGPKTARRIIVELKDKFVKISSDELPKEELEVSDELSDAYDALLALGYQIKDIKNVMLKIDNEGKSMNTQELIKDALSKLR